jgi:hypothetical protein
VRLEIRVWRDAMTGDGNRRDSGWLSEALASSTMQPPWPSGSARASGARGGAGGEVPGCGSRIARPVVGYLVFRGALHALVTFFF